MAIKSVNKPSLAKNTSNGFDAVSRSI
jgi:hypothetical protein